MRERTVGLIGLGIMGLPMAKNLLNAGFGLVVHDVNREPVEELAGLGATAASSPKEVAGQTGVVITMLPDSPDVELVALGPDGVMEGIRPGSIYVDMSTISPKIAVKTAEAGAKRRVKVLDAPVSGGDVGAQKGTLSIMVGGDEETFAEVLPIFQVLGRNIVLCGGKLAREAVLPVGKVHYQGMRIVGTTGSDPAASMKLIPASGEYREGDVIDVVGAGGPMGVMHVVRGLCQGVAGVKVLGGDLDDRRLAMLDKIARGPAEKNQVSYRSYNPSKAPPEEKGTYIVIMAPAVKLAAAAVQNGAAGAIINIFAGIPATVEGEIDLQSYIEKGMYFIGTSGSSLADMKTMLAKVQTGQIDTNVSVAAIGGLNGAIEGIRAIENQLVPGKIIIYPACEGLGLAPLEELATEMPEVASMLVDGMWTLEAEEKLLAMYS